MVLVVDDNRTTREILQAVLKSEGIRSDSSESGTAALEAAGIQQYDVFLVDYRMPKMTGDELTRSLRKAYPNSYIIGYSIESKDQAFLAAGADVFIIKDHLTEKIVPLIKNKLQSPESAISKN